MEIVDDVYRHHFGFHLPVIRMRDVAQNVAKHFLVLSNQIGNGGGGGGVVPGVVFFAI